MDKIYLPISKNYVSHWGFWESIREVLQNAIDTNDFDIDENYNQKYISITSNCGKLQLNTLLLGESSKSSDDSKIGKYGEGYKLALLVLARMGYEVRIRNGLDIWQTSIEKHPQLKTECLAINIITDALKEEELSNSVCFTISGLSEDDFNSYWSKYIDNQNDLEKIACYENSFCFNNEYEEKKRLYVAGLYVCDIDDDYEFSWNFDPSKIQLDRDRQSVCDFELSYEATRLFIASGQTELLAKLASSGCKEVSEYCINSSGGYISNGDGEKYTEESKNIAGNIFTDQYGEKAYPISQSMDNAKITAITQEVIKAGLTPVTVKSSYYEMLPDKIKKADLIPKINGKVSSLLIAFNDKYKLPPKAKKELSSMINALVAEGK